MPRLPIFTVDAFSSQPFSGNPAAVVPLTQELDTSIMQKVATEMNLSETAYVRPLDAGGDNPWASCSRYSLRWFTPIKEIPLCGHATLATAHVIFNNLGHSGGQVDFETLSGTLTVRKDGDQIVMDFPNNEATSLTDEEAQRLKSLVIATCSGMTVQEVLLCRTLKYLLVRLDDCYSSKDLEELLPDFSGMKRAHDGSQVMAVIVTVPGKKDLLYHAFSRFFAPLYGVDEDPVTGSAHTVLGPYWAKHLNTNSLTMRQCGQRGGDVRVRMRGADRVDLAGPATTVLQGHINF
ncbi:hypothetical protein O3P69_020166 [Scylla paramamosain]|uniref:Phenazine biosynthesis-like domain-containing protein n=1 Tax=Scylla paramamosain TaxID=85552 RepID=A0AAW0TN57_SCYPA